MNELPPLPRWFWLLPLVALAAWWPIDCWWQSDDFLAMHYAQELRRVLHDFTGPQYDAPDIWLFYRPLITLSFWLDQQIGGSGPFVAHLSNVLAHGASALLVGLLWRRWLPCGRAFAAGALWALLPSHAGSLAWAVGRVDSHTAVWCLSALLLAVRHAEARDRGSRAARWPMLLATAAALASKELAFVVPPLATLLAGAVSGAPGLAGRARAAAAATWPIWALFALYLPLRVLALGRFGGYLGASYDAAAMATGFLTIVGNLLVPLRWTGGAPDWLVAAAAAPPMLAAVAWVVRAPRRLAVAAAAFLLASVPMAAFFGDPANVHNLRYFYLPTAVFAGLLAGGGRLAPWLAAVAILPALAAIRTTQLAADRESAALHRALLREAHDGMPSPAFVAGLPHANANGSVVMLHFGVDRMLLPPFGPGGPRLFALRPLADVPGVVRLETPGEPPFALPGGSTWWFAAPSALARVPAATPELPDLPLAGDADGVVDLSTARLFDFAGRAKDLFAHRAPSFGLRTPGVKPMGYRVTIFTASGYLACLCFDYGLAGPEDGWIDLLRFLARDDVSGVQPAIYSVTGSAWAGEALTVPTTIDLDPSFPVLVEAGRVDPTTGRFTPTHRARRLLEFHFDHGYAGWTRALQGR